MKESFLTIIRCPKCYGRSFSLEEVESDQLEIRSARLICNKCKISFQIENGIVNFLDNPSQLVLRERLAMDEEEYITEGQGVKYRITDETIQRFRDKFLALPEGDGSNFFKRGGSFQTFAEASDRFYSVFNSLGINGRESVLEIGACFSFASFKFAKKGCRVVALDISNYLKASDVYIGEAYYDRVFSDMHDTPFANNTFDIVFAAAVLHHSKDLQKVFGEIYRVLKPGGRLILINETARGILERIHPVYKKMEERGFADTAYTLLEWRRGVSNGGFKKADFEFLSLADDYLTRHKNRNSADNYKLKLARFFRQHRKFERFIMLMLIPSRIIFRPKSWRLTAIK